MSTVAGLKCSRGPRFSFTLRVRRFLTSTPTLGLPSFWPTEMAQNSFTLKSPDTSNSAGSHLGRNPGCGPRLSGSPRIPTRFHWFHQVAACFGLLATFGSLGQGVPGRHSPGPKPRHPTRATPRAMTSAFLLRYRSGAPITCETLRAHFFLGPGQGGRVLSRQKPS